MPHFLFARQSAGTAEDAEFSNERLVNLYVRAWPDGALAPGLIKQTEGMITFANLGTDRPVRAMIRKGAIVYAVSGGKLFSVSSAGTVTELYGSLLDSANTTMFKNDNNEIGIAAGGTYYVWDISGASMSTPAMTALTGVQGVAFKDGYGILVDTASDRWQITGVSDATSLGALDFSSADDSTDGIVGVAAYNGYVWIFGEETIEPWRNTGAAKFPFQRVSGGTIPRGCFGAKTIIGEDQSLFWVGDDRIVYRMLEGPKRISTHAVERALRNQQDGDDLTAFTWTEDGHKLYGIRFPNAPAWVYDMNTQLWHERASDNFGESTWRANSSVRAFGYEILGSSDGILYRLSPTAYQEGSTSIARIAESAPVQDGDRFTYLDRVALEMKTGYVDIDREPQVMLQISRDGKLYTPEKFRGLSDLGDYRRTVSWNRQGSARRHQVRFKITDPIPVSIYGASYELSG